MSTAARRSRPAVFLDRDGTLIEDRGHLGHPSQVAFFNETVTSLQKLQEYFALFIVTHQPGVALGLISMQAVESVNEYIDRYLAKNGIRITSIYVCPHGRDENCPCIKPKPFFPIRAAEDHGIDLKRSFMVGDHPHDVQTATNIGAQGIYVLTGHGIKHRDQIPQGAWVVSGIRQAAELIVEQALLRPAEIYNS